jgi:O-antigen ligase
VLLLFAWPLLLEHLETLQSNAPAVYLRAGMMEEALRLFFSKPVLGVGLANSALEMHWQARPSVALPGPIAPVHNIVLLWFIETGLVGGSLYLLLLAAAVFPLWRVGWSPKDDRALLSGAFALGLLGVIAHNQAVWTLRWSVPLQVNFWVVAALGLALCAEEHLQINIRRAHADKLEKES